MYCCNVFLTFITNTMLFQPHLLPCTHGENTRICIKTVLSLPQSTGFVASPLGVILLRILALLICAFMIAVSFCDLPDKLNSQSEQQTLSGGVVPNKPTNDSEPKDQGSGGLPSFQGLLELLPDQVTENARVVWQHGRDNQIAVVSAGLLTCLTSIFLGGLVR